jgi:hypothetical protein
MFRVSTLHLQPDSLRMYDIWGCYIERLLVNQGRLLAGYVS